MLLLAPDLKEELPVLFLRLRHAVENDGVKVVELTSVAGSTSGLAAHTLLHRPGEAGQVVRSLLAGGSTPAGRIEADAMRPVAALLDAAPVTVVLGRPSVAEPAAALVDAAGAIHRAHPEVRFLSALRRGNVHGALDMGLAPGILPGRVTLDSGRSWFHDAGWSALPEESGLEAVGMLEAAAAGRVDVLVLLGADPLADFPDRSLATRALAGARTVIAADQFRTASVDTADVVLAAAGYAEVDGTTTNLEGRISVLDRKVTAPGTARADWIIAAELARRLGCDLGIESVDDIWAEIEALAPSHAGITADLLRSTEGRDGVVAPLRVEGDGGSGQPGHALDEEAAEHAVAAAAADEEPEQQAEEAAAAAAQADAETAPHDSAEAEEAAPPASAAPDATGSARPELLAFEPGEQQQAVPVDAYSLRLVTTRKLYDLGVGVQHCPSLAHLAGSAVLRVNAYDFARLGVADGTEVTVSSARGSVRLPVHADDGVPRGAAAVPVNLHGPAATDLIDATMSVTEVHVEVAQ